MSALAVVGSNRLPALAASINDHVAAAEQATKRGLEHAITAGKLLLAAKELVDHGGWLPWLEANCHLSIRQAQTYMRLARQCHKLDALKNAATAYLTIAAAETLVGKPRPEQPHGLPGQLDLLGGPEVPPASPIVPAASPVRDHAVLHLIADLEQAFAVIMQEADPDWYTQRRNKQLRGNRLRAAASTVATAIAFLKKHRRRMTEESP